MTDDVTKEAASPSEIPVWAALQNAPSALFRHTEKAFVAGLPRFVYEGRIVVVIGEEEAKRAVACLRRAPLVGVDTETRPAFRKGETHKVALLQLATEDICFLFRLNMMGFPECLVQLLADESVKKVGLSLHDDFLMLRQRCAFQPAGHVEIQAYVREMGIEDLSLQKLFANVFRCRISKNARLSNWEADVLTEAQQRYAATDAYACILLYERLHALRESGNYSLADPPVPAFPSN